MTAQELEKLMADLPSGVEDDVLFKIDYLARRVIAAEKLAEALRWMDDNPLAHSDNRWQVVRAALAKWEAAQ